MPAAASLFLSPDGGYGVGDRVTNDSVSDSKKRGVLKMLLEHHRVFFGTLAIITLIDPYFLDVLAPSGFSLLSTMPRRKKKKIWQEMQSGGSLTQPERLGGEVKVTASLW